MRIEWYINGRPLEAGSKYSINVDFGFVTLDILYTYPEDSGVYMCKAVNKSGEAISSASLKCQAKDSIISSPQNPNSAAKVAMLEAPKPAPASMPDKALAAPVFTTQLLNLGDLYEGQSAHFEATIIPTDDPALKIQWYHNGQPVVASSRIKMLNDFGWVILDITQVEARDSGEWLCHASNASGEAVTTGFINCLPFENIIYDPQQPKSVPKIAELEKPKLAPQAPPDKAPRPPKFTVPLPQFPPLEEGDSVHLEAQLIPIDDPNMKVEWFKDGKPVQYGHRFRPVNDFGFCVLDILYIMAEDNGQYTCRAVNKVGQDATSAVLQCAPRGGLILQPQVRDEKLQAIHQLEQSLHRTYDHVSHDKQRQAPVFIEPLQNPPPLREGENAYFSAKLNQTNDPDLNVSKSFFTYLIYENLLQELFFAD